MARTSLVFDGCCKICSKPLEKGPVYDINVTENSVEFSYGEQKIRSTTNFVRTICKKCMNGLKKLFNTPTREAIIKNL